MKIIIGTRGSKLSQTQTELVRQQLLSLDPTLEITTKIITTTGDKDLRPIPLDIEGKGWFTKELDDALLSGEIYIAVHSMKDLPEVLPKHLMIAGIPEREDARDVLISRGNIPLQNLPTGAIIGTDSIRRKVQILQKRQDLTVQSIRGNVDTRIRKLQEGQYDAIVLAAAGIKRLKMEKHITAYFHFEDIIPAPGQGALAVVTHEKNEIVKTLVEKLNHKETVLAVQAERAFAQVVGGGCKTPTGAYALCHNNIITLYGMLANPENSIVKKAYLTRASSQPERLGKDLAKKLLQQL